MVINKTKQENASRDTEYIEKGNSALAQGEYDMAIQYFSQLVKMQPDSEEYRELLSQAELEKSKSQVNFLTRPIYTLWALLMTYVFRNPKAGFKTSRILAKSKPGSKLAAQMYISCALKTKRPSEAIQTCEMYLKEKPFDETILQTLAKIYFDRMDYVSALRSLDALRKLKPDDQEIARMYDIAITQKYTIDGVDVKKKERIEEERQKVEAREKPKLDQGKVNELIEQCKENPEDVDLRLQLGRMLLDGEQEEQALAVFEAASEIEPSNPKVIEELARAYDQTGRDKEADDLYEKLAILKPGDKDLQKLILDRKIARGETVEETETTEVDSEELERLKRERLDMEIAEYRQKVKDNPGNADLQIELGQLLRKKGELEEAITFFQQAARNPTRGFIACKLAGEAFYDKGMLDIASEQLQRALEKVPTRTDFMTRDTKEIHYMLSEIHEDLGELDKAIEFLKPVYEEDLGFKDVRTRFEGLYEKKRAAS